MRKLFTLFIATFMLLMLASTGAFAQTSVWDGTAASWTQGTGAEDDPYLIASAQNLAYLAEMVNGGVSQYEGIYFKITTDIDLDSLEWMPIGDYSTTNAIFKGNLDGDNHRITNMKISRSTLSYGGLFGYVSGVTIGNLNVEGTVTTSKSSCYIGGLIGGAVGVITIYNCINYANVTSNVTSSSTRKYSYSGGLIGYSASTGTIVGCSNVGNISSTLSASESQSYSYSGGIIGYSYRSCTIIGCKNSGTISSTTSSSGSYTLCSYSAGIIGYSESSCTINKCFNIGNISSISRIISSSYNSSANPLSWSNGITNKGSITNCYNNGNVSASAYFSSYNAQINTNQANASGISLSGAATNCYNAGSISASGYSYFSNRYGIGNGSTTNCYYCRGNGGNGISKTEDAMKSESFPILLNPDVYIMDLTPNVNDGFPIFGSSVCTITTNPATNLNFTSAILNGEYVAGEFWPGAADMQGFEWKPASASEWTTVYTNVGTPASYDLTGLENGTDYQYRMFVKLGEITIYGNTVDFTTRACDVAVSVTTGNATICDNTTAALTANATSSGSISSYSWSTGGNGTDITVNAAGTYTVSVTDEFNCTAEGSIDIEIKASPTAAISGNAYLCTGNSTTLTAQGGVGYVWSTGATTPMITVSEVGSYSVIARASNGCTDTTYVNVAEFNDVIITGNNTICAGESTTLTVSEGSSYLWSTGATTQSINVTSEGLYSVTVTYSQCEANTSVYVTVNALPTPAITGVTAICGGASTTLTATGGTEYAWSNGATTPSIEVSTSGNYRVTVTNANGCAASASTSVVSAPNPSVQITGNTTACAGTQITLTATGGTEYSWSNSANTATINPTQSGTYTVTAYNALGCSATASASVTINESPVPQISGDLAICDGSSTTLTVNGGDSFVWSNGSTNASVNVTNAGTYTVIASNANGCTASASAVVSFLENPSVTISGNPSICAGGATTLTAEGGNSYLWSTGFPGASINVNAAGTYSVIATGANGCTSSASLSVAQYSAPEVSITGNTTVCEGSNTTITANGGVSYQWSTGETGASISVNAFGIYSVTATGNGGCTATANATVFVASSPTPSINGNLHICDNEATTLTANGGDSYMWSNGSTGNSINVTNGGTYSVIATNASGCTAMASANVEAGYSVTNSITATAEAEYTWNGQTYTATGDYTQSFIAANGCDSIVTLHLTITGGQQVQHYNIFVISSNSAYGTVTGTGVYEENEVVTITASANEGYEFLSWNDGNPEGIRQIVVTGDATYIATFIPATGIEESVALEINVFPNPATDILYITSSETISEIEIVNVIGQVVRRIEVNGDNAVCNVEDLTSGVYVVRIRTASATLSQQRFVKE